LELVVLVALVHQAGQMVEIQYLARSQLLAVDVVVCKQIMLALLVDLVVVAVAETAVAFKLTLVVQELLLQFKVTLVVVVVTQVLSHLVAAVAVELAQQELTGAMNSVVMVETE
jgi:hypothetical protein